VFSGPQVGEKLAPFKAKAVFGEQAGQEYDPIEQAAGKPVALVFVHERTRPAFGMTNAVMKYAASKAAQIHGGVIFLTDDPTETATWMRRVEKYFPEGVSLGISVDGLDGPGAYGLNRNVALTVLVGAAGKVTANFALVQPSLPTDGPKILQAIADVSGGGKPPAIERLTRRPNAARARPNMQRRTNDPQLTSLLRAVINKQASDGQVRAAAAKLEQYVADKAAAQGELGRIAATVVGSGKLGNYGTPAAQQLLKKWAEAYGKPTAEKPGDKQPQPKQDRTDG
jgi:hypothetical protein